VSKGNVNGEVGAAYSRLVDMIIVK